MVKTKRRFHDSHVLVRHDKFLNNYILSVLLLIQPGAFILCGAATKEQSSHDLNGWKFCSLHLW